MLKVSSAMARQGTKLVAILSPAKTMNFQGDPPSTHGCSETTPRLTKQASVLVEQVRTLSKAELRKLMKLSASLGASTHAAFKDFDLGHPSTQGSGARCAAFAFSGVAFRGLSAGDYDGSTLAFAQDHLRILCGLYGVLRPLDVIQRYRLEMGLKLAVGDDANLYEFWRAAVTRTLSDDLGTSGAVLVNLASKEYFGAIDSSRLPTGTRVVTPVFRDDGRIKSALAKRARGLMCRYMMENRVDSVEALREFDVEGYKYAAAQSSDDTLVFTRRGGAPKPTSASKKKAQPATARTKRGRPSGGSHGASGGAGGGAGATARTKKRSK